jgi:hypothetical protein
LSKRKEDEKLLRPGMLAIIVILFIVFLLLKPGTQETNAFVQATLEETELSNPDAESYAKHMGVSLDEALRRFRIMDTAGILQADISVNEAETFAGLWIEHSPEFRVIVLFIRNPRQTIKPYLEKEYITRELVDVLCQPPQYSTNHK